MLLFSYEWLLWVCVCVRVWNSQRSVWKICCKKTEEFENCGSLHSTITNRAEVFRYSKSNRHPWFNNCILARAEHLKHCSFFYLFTELFLLLLPLYKWAIKLYIPYEHHSKGSSFSFSQLFSQVSVIIARARTHPPPHTWGFVCAYALLCSQGRFVSAQHCSLALPPAAGDRSALWLLDPLPQSPN